ncbi:hypothetical protein Tco_1327273 [Tanacetum coccineum]
MALSIADQIALDDALVAPADRLKIGKCNLRLSSDVTSKEATLQVVYDVLKLTPFYKAFQVTADAPEIYMQEFWASAYVHDLAVRQISPKGVIRSSVENTFEEGVLIFQLSLGSLWRYKERPLPLMFNKLHNPGDLLLLSSTYVLSGKPSFDSLRLSQSSNLVGGTDQGTHSSHASGSGADEGTGVTPGVPDAPNYDSEDDISWKSSDDDQDDEQAQDDEDADKNDVNETKQDDEDDDEHDDNETDQNDDDEEQTESDDDGDDFVHPKLTTHDDDIIHEEETDEDASFDPTIHTPSRISSSDDEDSDNEVEGANVEGAKSDEMAELRG